MTRGEAINWLINISADIGKQEHKDLWHYEQALLEIREMLEAQPETDQIRWERDTAIQQLADLGYGLGEKPRADGDCISRQAVKKWLTKWEGYIDADIIARMQYRVIDIPSAQPEERTETHACDCISRQAAIDAIERNAYRHTYIDQIVDIIKALPSAQPERKKSEWEEIEVMADAYDISVVKTWASKMMCNQCGFTTIAIEGRFSQYNFCPNCGADMRGEQE